MLSPQKPIFTQPNSPNTSSTPVLAPTQGTDAPTPISPSQPDTATDLTETDGLGHADDTSPTPLPNPSTNGLYPEQPVTSVYKWRETTDHSTVQDAFAIVTALPDGRTIVGYPALPSPDAEIQLFQVSLSGDPFSQTDLARILPPGELAIVACGYYPDIHKNEIPHKRNIGHACLAVGVEHEGKAGVMTINNPQAYLGGAFDNAGYGSFFFQQLQFPAGLSAAEIAAYRQNIVTMTAIANSFIPFAEGNFNGQDPLGIHNVAKVKEAGDKLILAVYGDEAAIDWLKQGNNTAYCAELVSAGVNIGTNTVLTQSYLDGLQQRLADEYGEDRYPNLYEVVRQKVESGEVLSRNNNPNKQYLTLGMVDASVDLQPITDRCPEADQSGTGLAFMYYDFTDIAYASIRDTYPRRDLATVTAADRATGEAYNAMVAQVQIHAFQEAANQFKSLARLSPQVADAFDHYVNDAVIPALSTVYPSTAERNAVMAELIEQGRQFTPTGPNGEGMFIPPDLYLRPTTGWATLKTIGVGFFPEHLTRIT